MIRGVALALTVLTGFSGLVYEVAWQKYVATLLGSHSEATASVLALYLGGLSLGYGLFGRVTRGIVGRGSGAGRLLLAYGVIEAGIGCHAFAFPTLFSEVRELSYALPPMAAGVGFGLDVLLVAALILPPTVLMGGTIPILTQALSTGSRDATRVHALVYGANTFGAFAGALAAGFVLVPELGLQGVVLTMGAINLGAGVTFVLLGARGRSPGVSLQVSSGAPVSLGLLGVVSLAAGFAAMTLQTVLIRVAGLALGSSEFTFSAVVSVFVLCIALGSLGVSALPRIQRGVLVGVQWTLALLLVALYFVIADTPYWAYWMRVGLGGEAANFERFHALAFGAMLGVLCVPIGLSGATLPLIFDHLRGQVGELGSAAGRLYAWNTVGSLLGALLGGYLLLFWLDLDGVYLTALAAVAVSATLLTIHALDFPRSVVLAIAPILLVLTVLPRWDPDRLSSGLFRVREARVGEISDAPTVFAQVRPGYRGLFYDDDPISSVAVYRAPRDGDEISDLAIITNGKPDGSIGRDYATMALAGTLPALFAQRAERAFVIGFGTGVTVGELGAIDSMQEVVVAEISPAVVEAGELFESFNQGALANPRTRVVVSDAFRALSRGEKGWDVIVSEPSNPWVTGVEMLFSEEFLTTARDSLRPGGVYAQWFHLYEVDGEVIELVLRTYVSVFDHVAVWYTLGNDVILLGFESDALALDAERLEERASRPDFAASLERAGIESFPSLLAHELLPLGVVHHLPLDGDVHTLLRPVLSHRAARAFFAGRRGAVPRGSEAAAALVGADHSLLRRFARARGAVLSDAEQEEVVRELCARQPAACATWVASWVQQRPRSERRAKLLAGLRRHKRLAAHLRAPRLGALALLLGDAAAVRAHYGVAQATQLTDLFEHYYSHATPFDRAVLGAVWDRCRDDEGGVRCAGARTAVEARLGPLPGPQA